VSLRREAGSTILCSYLWMLLGKLSDDEDLRKRRLPPTKSFTASRVVVLVTGAVGFGQAVRVDKAVRP
jgi:hypothetical protein